MLVLEISDETIQDMSFSSDAEFELLIKCRLREVGFDLSMPITVDVDRDRASTIYTQNKERIFT